MTDHSSLLKEKNNPDILRDAVEVSTASSATTESETKEQQA